MRRPGGHLPGRGAGFDSVGGALGLGRAAARTVPVAPIAVAHQPNLCSPPGQERLSLFQMWGRRQRSGPVGRIDVPVIVRRGARPVPAPGPTGALAGSVPAAPKASTLVVHTRDILDGEPSNARTVSEP